MQKTEVPSHPTDILFIDIETVKTQKWEDLTERKKGLWIKRFDYEIIAKIADQKISISSPENHEKLYQETAEKVYNEKSAFLAEYSRVACVAVGFIKMNADGVMHLTTKCMIDHDEKKILEELAGIVSKPTVRTMLAHNGKEFDFPFLSRRYLMNDLPVPALLNTFGKKPWDVNLLDTLEIWKFTSMRHSISLDLLAESFGIPSPKTIMDGKDVENYFYHTEREGLAFETEPERWKKLSDYCVGDVVTNVMCYLKMTGHRLILEENITRK